MRGQYINLNMTLVSLNLNFSVSTYLILTYQLFVLQNRHVFEQGCKYKFLFVLSSVGN